MNSIAQAQLERLVSTINTLTGSPLKPYTQDPETKQVRSNTGNFHISSAYGGFNLERMSNTDGETETVFCCVHTTRLDLYYMMQAFILGLKFGKQA